MVSSMGKKFPKKWRKIDGNYQIVDIGIDIKKENRSPFYAKEKELINKSNYPIIKVED